MKDVWVRVIYDEDSDCYRPDLPKKETDEAGNVIEEGISYATHYGYRRRKDGQPDDYVLVTIGDGDADAAEAVAGDTVPQRIRDAVEAARYAHRRDYAPVPADTPVDVPKRGGQ